MGQATKNKIKDHPCMRSYHTRPRGISARQLHQYSKGDAAIIEQKQYYIVARLPKSLDVVEDLGERFKKLAESWERETAHLSLTRQQTSRMSFLRIIALGEKALPL